MDRISNIAKIAETEASLQIDPLLNWIKVLTDFIVAVDNDNKPDPSKVAEELDRLMQLINWELVRREAIELALNTLALVEVKNGVSDGQIARVKEVATTLNSLSQGTSKNGCLN